MNAWKFLGTPYLLNTTDRRCLTCIIVWKARRRAHIRQIFVQNQECEWSNSFAHSLFNCGLGQCWKLQYTQGLKCQGQLLAGFSSSIHRCWVAFELWRKGWWCYCKDVASEFCALCNWRQWGKMLPLKGALNPKDKEAIQRSGQRLVTTFLLIQSSGWKPETVGRETVIHTLSGSPIVGGSLPNC